MNINDSSPSSAAHSPDSAPLPAWMAQLEQSRAEERRQLQLLLGEHLEEQRKGRRSRSWFRLFIALYLLLLLGLNYSDQWDFLAKKGAPDAIHTAVVDLRGTIMPDKEFGAENVIAGLRDAFDDAGTKGIILRINSPGGSPVQAGIIYDEVVRLRQLHPEIPVYAALEDLCASGGYYVASAAQEIYADKATLVGSIGVIMRGFGFQETMAKLGVESRLLTAGENKAFLDPFEPAKEKDKLHAQKLLNTIHEQFIRAVRTGRGDRLKSQNDALFSGLIWTGEEALSLGLVDGLGSTEWIAREKIKAERLVDFTYESDIWSRFSKKLVSSLAELPLSGGVSLPLFY